MKYTILINQYAAVNSGLDLDLIDLAIFDFIKDFANCASCVKMHTPEGIYFWISHKLILEAMPLLNIKTSQGMIKRIDNLIKAGILQKHPNCELYNKTLYCFGENYELLTFTEKAARILTGVDTPKQKLMPPINESLGVPINESLGYNNNNIDNPIMIMRIPPTTMLSGELFPEEQKVEEPRIKKHCSAIPKFIRWLSLKTALAWIIPNLKVSFRPRNLKRSIWFITFTRLAIGATKKI